MSVVSILQPSYLPWLGTFDLIDRSDIFVFYDDVQYDKNGWRNRNRINTAQGVKWLTVPVLQAGVSSQRLSETQIDTSQPWPHKHIETLRQSYAGAPHRDEYLPELEDVLSRPWRKLVDVNLELMKALCGFLGVSAEFFRSSELGIGGDRSGRLLDICRHFGARTYLSTDAGRNYLDVERFSAANIDVQWQQYRHPRYSQHREGFVDHLSVVDVLFEAGAKSGDLIRSGRPR